MGALKRWLDNARFLATGQSQLPAVLAAVLAIGQDGFSFPLALAAVVGVVCVHCAMNLIDDLHDYRADLMAGREKAVREGFKAYMAKYPYLTDGSATLSSLWRAICAFGGVALALGVLIFVLRTAWQGFGSAQGSWWIPAIAALTALLGWFYSAPPLKLSFHGLGEAVVGLVFGPLLMLGVHYAACGRITSEIVVLSLPVGLLVMNLLYTHSVIDRKGDEASGKKTLPALLPGRRAVLAGSALLNFGPFLLLLISALAGWCSPWYLSAFLVLPRAVWLFSSLCAWTAGHGTDERHPARWLGPMNRWDEVLENGLEWYLIRWFTARNIVTGLSLCLAVTKIALLIFA